MKKLIFLTCCIAGLFSCSQKRPAVIERPIFEVSNATMLEIDKIEMTDSATILHFDAFFEGGWITLNDFTFIRESGSDEKLMVTGSEGLNLNERITVQESKTISFKMIFPPLRPGVTKIDFMEECPEPTCWKIMGIHLLPNAKIKFDPVPKDMVNITNKPLPAPTYSTQPTRISGRILGYVAGIAPSQITVYTRNIISGESDKTEFQVSEDGSFSGEVIPGIAGMYSSSLGNLFLVPGQETKIYIDLKKRSLAESRYRTDKDPKNLTYTYISGYFTKAELDSISQATNGMFDYMKLAQETVNMKPEEFKSYILSLMNTQIDHLKQKNYPANMQLMAENNIKLSAFSLLMQYESFINFAYIQGNNIKPAERSKVTFKPEKPDDNYYTFLKGQVSDDMVYLPGFSSLFDNLIRLYSLPDGNDRPAKERFAYFKEKVAPVLGTDKGFLFDLAQIKYYGAQLNDMKFYTDAEKQEIRDVFKDNPAYAEALIAESDKLEALLAANKENKESILNELPQVSQEKMFDAILAKYKGKVVLVDFWATWCGPCMAAMKSILPMKEEMKGKDVVFLYLTGETSPLGAFTRTYPTISGEHYRVSEKQWNYWYKTFGIQGIPTYMVYDRKGKQLARHIGFPGVDTIRKDIEKGL